jgi:uncharacterized membrane protein
VKNLTVYWSYLTIFFGLAYIFILPPFQSPDEPNHFIRIYHIAQGHFNGEVSPDKLYMGGYIYKDLPNTFSPFLYLPFKVDSKISPDSIISKLCKPIDSKEQSFNIFPNTARYAFTAYLPQVVITYLLDKVGAPPLIILYAQRLAAFLFWIVMLRWVVQITPVYKEVLMLLSFLPTSLAINSTLSADVVSNAFAFLIFALFLKFKFGTTIVFKKDAVVFFIVMLLLSWQKIVYFPLCFLLLLIPKAKFQNYNRKIIFCSTVIALNLVLVLWWSAQINKLVYPSNNKNVTTYSKMRPECEINPILQVEDIFEQPIKFIKEFSYASFKSYDSFGDYLTSFGWEGITVTRGLLILFKISILFFILTRENLFRGWERFFLILLGHGLVMSFLLSQHLHWACVGEDIIRHFGGKYYIPIYPIIFFSIIGLISNIKIFKENKNYVDTYFVVLPIVVQIEFLYLMVGRYYP